MPLHHNAESLCQKRTVTEAEAIVLALQMKAGRVLLDEREGRRVAKSLGLLPRHPARTRRVPS